MKETIQVVLVILVILFVVIIVSNYFTLQAVTGNAMHAAMSNIVWTTEALQDAETDKERLHLLADLSISIRHASQTVKLVADKTIFFDRYDLRQLWTYVAFVHAEGETDIDVAVIKIQDLGAIVEETGILDITADKGYMYISDPKGCKEKLQTILKECEV